MNKECSVWRLLPILSLIILLGTLQSSCAASAPTVIPTSLPTATSLPTVTPQPTFQPNDSEHKVIVEDEERSYLLHVPPSLDAVHPIPVVFAFHAADSQPADIKSISGLDAIANSNGFLVVYPKGIERTWNAGACCGVAADRNVDEAAFIRQILSDLSGAFNLDPKRIYATGVSNGGALAYRLACEMSDTFAAVAPVATALLFDPCTPKEPVSIVQMQGLKDELVPYEGGGEYNIPPVEQLISNWAKLDSCMNAPQVDTSQKFIKHISYSACKVGSAVELYTIEIGYHSWPSDAVIPASQLMWAFFAAHPKP